MKILDHHHHHHLRVNSGIILALLVSALGFYLYNYTEHKLLAMYIDDTSWKVGFIVIVSSYLKLTRRFVIDLVTQTIFAYLSVILVTFWYDYLIGINKQAEFTYWVWSFILILSIIILCIRYYYYSTQDRTYFQ